MYVLLGNDKPKQGNNTEVDPDAYSLDELKQQAADKGVDGSGTKAEIAARLSAFVEFTPLDGPSETEVNFPEDVKIVEAFTTITAATSGIWSHHSDEPPSYVISDNDSLAMLLSEHFGCEVRSS